MLRLLLLLACCASAIAEDRQVAIDHDLAGQLMLPAAPTDRAVLMLHGWNSHRDEVGDLYLDLAAALAEQGIASLRFNFTGEGPQADYVVTSTFDSRIEESTRAYRFLREQFPDARIGVQGFSLGGLTAMKLAGQQPEWFTSMVLWSAAETMRPGNDPVFEDAARLAMRDGRSLLKSWTDVTLTREFLASFVGVNARTGLASFKGPVLTIRGTEDFLPSHDRAWLALLPTEEKSFLLIGGADHIFNVLDSPRPGYGLRTINATVNWFDRTL